MEQWNSSEGSGSGRDSQNGDGDDDDGDEESKHSHLGACSTLSSQKGDASTEDQTSQAEEMPAKNTGKKLQVQAPFVEMFKHILYNKFSSF